MRLTRIDDYLTELQELYPEFSKELLKEIVEYGLKRTFAIAKSGLSVRLGIDPYLTITRSQHIWKTKNQIKRSLIAKARYKKSSLRYEPVTKWYLPIYKSQVGLTELENVRVYKLYKEAFYRSMEVHEIEYEPAFYFGWYTTIDKLKYEGTKYKHVQ